MEILINDKPIDFTLEGERTVGEVLAAVNAWLGKGGYIASAIRVNGKAVDPAARPESVEEVERIEFDAVESAELPRESLSVLRKYLDLLSRTLDAGDDAAAGDALAEYRFVRSSLHGFLGQLLGTAGEEHFQRIDVALAALADRPDAAAAAGEETKAALARTIRLVDARLSELEHPDRELEAVMGLIHGMLDDVRNVPVQLQTGKDPEAMQTVIRFTELTGKMLRLLPSVQGVDAITVDDASIDEHIQGLNQTLTELTEAFAAEDTVLIGDLLEYEIVERIDALITALRR